MNATDRLRALVAGDLWMMAVLATVRDVDLPDAWVGAGVVRDLVWDRRYAGAFDPARVHDVDVPFFDAEHLGRERDGAATALLRAARADVPWEAKNQAAVHTWYQRRFGGPAVPPLGSIAEAVATWPETATAVALAPRCGRPHPGVRAAGPGRPARRRLAPQPDTGGTRRLTRPSHSPASPASTPRPAGPACASSSRGPSRRPGAARPRCPARTPCGGAARHGSGWTPRPGAAPPPSLRVDQISKLVI